MNRKVMGALAGVAVVVVVVWFFFLRGGGGEKPVAKQEPAKPGQKLAATAPTTQTAAARGFAAVDSFDVDVEGPLRLEGQVQGPDGSPVSGALVEISTNPRRTVKTEDDGSFAFDKLVGRTYYLSASSNDLVGGPVTYKLIANADPVVIRMLEGSKLEVLVQDVDKKPIADAEVKRDRDSSVRTGSDGKAMIKPVRSGWAGVQVSANGYANASAFATIGSPGSTGHVTVTLKKGYLVSGKVVDERGVAIGNAHVASKSDGAINGFGEAGDPAITNGSGEFSVVLATGSHRFRVTDGEHAPTTSPPVTVKDAPVTGVTITMKGGGMIVGRVDDKDGKPVAFATVRLADKRTTWGSNHRQATTDKAGVFEIHGLIRQKFQLRAESDQSASKVSEVDLTSAETVRDVVLVLDVSGTITGIVVDETGQPVPEVQVHAMPDMFGGAKPESMALAGLSTATSDASGNFAVHGLPDGAYKLWAERTQGGFRGGFDDHAASGHTGDKNVKIVMPAPGIVIGKVLLDGKPPSMGTVAVGPGQSPTPFENGEFTVKDLSPGKFDAVFRGPEFAELIKRDVKVEPGKTTDLGTIDLSKGRTVTGKVIDASNNPVIGARVRLGAMLFTLQGMDDEQLDDQRGMRVAATDQDGSFTISGVGKKGGYIAAEHPDRGQSLALSYPEGTEDPPPMTLPLRAWGSITGTVTLKGQPVPEVGVSESSKGGGAALAVTQTDDSGSFTMLKVAEGAHTLQVMRQAGFGMKSTSVTVNVVAGAPTHVDIAIPTGTLTLSVAIKPLPGATVTWAMVALINGLGTMENGKQLLEGLVGGSLGNAKPWFGAGTADFDELMPGTYTICSLPVTGAMNDPQIGQRMQENGDTMKVYCQPVQLTQTTTVTQSLPSMTPMPQ